jgi:CBS domain-containing protein
MHNRLRSVLEEKGADVHAVTLETSVLDAVRRMNQHRVGAVLVIEDGQPVGIFTERDVLRRVVDPGRDPAATRIGDVMTTDLVCVRPETTVQEAMAVISERRCRHLPVLDGDRLTGLVSIGDLTHWMVKDQHIQIRDLVDFITAKYPR